MVVREERARCPVPATHTALGLVSLYGPHSAAVGEATRSPYVPSQCPSPPPTTHPHT